ncbi:serine acetyltransferase [Alteromonas sp. NFXS44]
MRRRVSFVPANVISVVTVKVLKLVFEKVKSDLRYKQAVFADDGAHLSLPRLLLTDGTSATLLFRMSHRCRHGILSPAGLLLQMLNKWINGCVIGVKAEFGRGLVIMHPVGVVINSKVKTGDRVVIESGVVIGDEKGQSPVIGNDVFIGTGAKIIGGVTIGDNVKIGANAVVVKDIPSGCTALGIPAKPR